MRLRCDVRFEISFLNHGWTRIHTDHWWGVWGGAAIAAKPPWSAEASGGTTKASALLRGEIGFAWILSRSDIPRIAVGFNPRNRGKRDAARRVATVDGPGGFNLRIPNAGIEIPRSVSRRYATKSNFLRTQNRGLKSTAMRRLSLRDTQRQPNLKWPKLQLSLRDTKTMNQTGVSLMKKIRVHPCSSVVQNIPL